MKVDYGVRALVDLAQNHGGGPVQTAEIASRQGVPEPYLDQLLATMRKVGLVTSRRGPHGGYTLAKEPSELSLGAIMNALEGPSVPIDCLDGSLECNLSGHCGQQDIWKKVEDLTQAVLYSTKLIDLVHTREHQQQRAMYYI